MTLKEIIKALQKLEKNNANNETNFEIILKEKGQELSPNQLLISGICNCIDICIDQKDICIDQKE